MRKPDFVQLDKGHGRIEQREVWVVGAGELGQYLARYYGWPGVRQVGWIRRYRKHVGEVDWEQKKVSTWITSMDVAKANPAKIAEGLRTHWGVEVVHWIRDVTMDEDRLHGRMIGLPLAAIRNTAINLIRKLRYRFIPDGRRVISARTDFGLALLTRRLER